MCETDLPICVCAHRMYSSYITPNVCPCICSNSANTHALPGQWSSLLIWVSVSCGVAVRLWPCSLTLTLFFFWGILSNSDLSLSNISLLLLDFSSPNCRNKTLGRIGNPLANGFFDNNKKKKRKVESCTQQMVRGEWIRAQHDRCTLLTHVLQNKRSFKNVSVCEFLLKT